MEHKLTSEFEFEEATTTASTSATRFFPNIVSVVWPLVIVWLTFLLLKHWRLVAIVFKTLPRDLKGATRFVSAVLEIRKYEKSGESVVDAFHRTVEKYPTKVCFVFENQEWTFQQIWERSNQIGNYFLSQGYKKGDSVALFMENCPEYVSVWLGLSQIGVVTYLINTSLRLKSLKHSLEVANCKAIICGEELCQPMTDVMENDLLINDMQLFLVQPGVTKTTEAASSLSPSLLKLKETSTNLTKELQSASKAKPIVDLNNKPTFSDPLFCIYTSGTTGLPKAAIVKHSRFIGAATVCHRINALSPKDIIYTCLPFFHTSAEVLGVGNALIFGNTVVIKKKFSASSFWKDCIAHKVTVAQHIGELCRYLLNQPVTIEETQHRVRLMFGNGLRPKIWQEFVSRFKIEQVTEFYASTEGNCNMVSFDGRVGAVGFLPILLYKLYPVGIFKVDEETGELMREAKTGRAIRCLPNEPGELLGKIVENNVYREFNGYARNLKDTEKKIVSNVFSKGDSAFRTGDYLIMDELGYFYFKDRSGDTFRWKGENVSTTEVEGVLSSICGLKDCVVYGVEIPGAEGKAGMATIADPNNSLDLSSLAEGVKKALPVYACPLFIRVSSDIESTGTYKLKKVDLQREGFNVTEIKAPIYFYSEGSYVRLDEELYKKIIGGQIRL